MTTRVIALLAVLALPCILSAEPFCSLRGGELPFLVVEVPDSLRANPLTIMMRDLAPHENEGGFSLPFDLDRLFSFANLIDGFEFPGGIRFLVGLDRIGLGLDF